MLGIGNICRRVSALMNCLISNIGNFCRHFPFNLWVAASCPCLPNRFLPCRLILLKGASPSPGPNAPVAWLGEDVCSAEGEKQPVKNLLVSVGIPPVTPLGRRLESAELVRLVGLCVARCCRGIVQPLVLVRCSGDSGRRAAIV